MYYIIRTDLYTSEVKTVGKSKDILEAIYERQNLNMSDSSAVYGISGQPTKDYTT